MGQVSREETGLDDIGRVLPKNGSGSMPIREVLVGKRQREVFTIGPKDTVFDALSLMAEKAQAKGEVIPVIVQFDEDALSTEQDSILQGNGGKGKKVMPLEELDLQKSSDWEKQLWSFIGKGNGALCPLYRSCQIRSRDGWCPNEYLDELHFLLMLFSFDPFI